MAENEPLWMRRMRESAVVSETPFYPGTIIRRSPSQAKIQIVNRLRSTGEKLDSLQGELERLARDFASMNDMPSEVHIFCKRMAEDARENVVTIKNMAEMLKNKV